MDPSAHARASIDPHALSTGASGPCMFQRRVKDWGLSSVVCDQGEDECIGG
jgi:hypothetical protein